LYAREVNRLRVAIVGGGLGDLGLAQGLHRAGIDVAVCERDAALADRRQGYRLYGFAAVQASREAEAGPGARRGGVLFWLYRRLASHAS
jgi:2-polyprenyl-6-methoxyphenol hydroxylase-like FAD-dependent oxidoreductase